MSASEKLKALVAQWHGTGGERLDAQRTMLDALPQLVAVVEAAEKLSADYEESKPAAAYTPVVLMQLNTALAALEEALS